MDAGGLDAGLACEAPRTPRRMARQPAHVRDVRLEACEPGDGRREVRGGTRDGLGDPPRLRDVATAFAATIATIMSPLLIMALVDIMPPALGLVGCLACFVFIIWALVTLGRE